MGGLHQAQAKVLHCSFIIILMSLQGMIQSHQTCWFFFHVQMGEYAQGSHTVVSVLGIEGSDCKLEALSSCASITNGTINILHPLEMVREIRQISQNPIVATEVEVVYLLHPLVSTDKKSESPCVTKVTEWIGNVTQQTDISLNFTVDGSKLNNITTLPFQVYM